MTAHEPNPLLQNEPFVPFDRIRPEYLIPAIEVVQSAAERDNDRLFRSSGH